MSERYFESHKFKQRDPLLVCSRREMSMAPAAVSRVDSKPKPGRSEEADYDAAQKELIAETVRQKFAESAPIRVLKPSRSDDSAVPDSASDVPPPQGPIPEYLKFQTLVQESPSQTIVTEYVIKAPADFVQTEYYKDLYAVDKNLHHMTGSGFIQVETNAPASYDSLQSAPVTIHSSGIVDVPEEFMETEYYKGWSAGDKSLHHTTGSGFIQVENTLPETLDVKPASLPRTKSGCNPATNDWIPAEQTPEAEASKKPNRSEA